MTFEEWAEKYFGHNVDVPEACRDAWKAALLEAADRCHVEHLRDDLTGDYRFGAGMCEHYIRLMAEGER